MNGYLTKENLQRASKYQKDVPHMSAVKWTLKHTQETLGK